MEFVRLLLLFVHFLGLAVLVGAFVAQVREAGKGVTTPTVGMLHGALTQVVTGVLLVGVNEGMDNDVDHAKIGVKLLVALVVLGLILWGRRKPLATPLFMTIGLLAVANIGIAVFWT